MTAALASGSTARPPLPQPRARALPLLLDGGPSPFKATSQPSSGPPETEDLRPNPLTGTREWVAGGLRQESVALANRFRQRSVAERASFIQRAAAAKATGYPSWKAMVREARLHEH